MEKFHFVCRAATPEDFPALARMSVDWESENNCRGYCRNNETSLSKFRIFVAEISGKVIGYIYGSAKTSNDMGAVMPDNSSYFEIEELYVQFEYRSQGVGRTLMKYLEDTLLAENIDKIVLSTASNDYRRILHFYIDELGMSFWSARLFKELRKQ
jgi:ribosomal protein S18 acetylase RimI-like enzyme